VLTLFRNRLFLAIASGHFGVDILNSAGPVLLAVLSRSWGLSYAQIGFALTLYTLLGSLSQPVFGWLADRRQGRPAVLAGLGVAWIALCFGAAALAQSWVTLLPCFLLAALGSGLFHPIGTASAVAAHPTRAGSATALFFFCGQVGLAIGPALGGFLFRVSGNLGLIPLCVFLLLPGGLLLTAPGGARTPRPRSRFVSTRARTAGGIVAAFIALVALRSSIQAVYTAFLPKLFADRNWDSVAYGMLAGAFMLAAAIGNIVTGELADRRGMRMATVGPLLLSVPAGLVCLWAPTPTAAFVASALAGLLIGGQHSVLVVHAQRLIPAQQGFAAGLILGFTFAAGGIGTWVVGMVADQVGLLRALQAITLLGLPAALLALTLPGSPASQPVAVAAEA
jgi:FSR family fosmidomycin resistance protein-like MFS transporter